MDFLLLFRDLPRHNSQTTSRHILRSSDLCEDVLYWRLTIAKNLTIFLFLFYRSSVGGRVGKNPFGAEQRTGGDFKRSTGRDWRPIARNWGKKRWMTLQCWTYKRLETWIIFPIKILSAKNFLELLKKVTKNISITIFWACFFNTNHLLELSYHKLIAWKSENRNFGNRDAI